MYIYQLPLSLRKKIFFCGAVFSIVLILDQLSKYFVITYTLLPVFFNNTIAFSLPIAWYLPWLFLFVSLIYVSLTNKANYFSIEKLDTLLSKRLLSVALPLIVGGGISNIIDRVFHNGSVVDFIDLRYWPVFNLADSAIVIGVFLIIYHLYQKKGA